jgi:hypothetical protein
MAKSDYRTTQFYALKKNEWKGLIAITFFYFCSIKQKAVGLTSLLKCIIFIELTEQFRIQEHKL